MIEKQVAALAPKRIFARDCSYMEMLIKRIAESKRLSKPSGSSFWEAHAAEAQQCDHRIHPNPA